MTEKKDESFAVEGAEALFEEALAAVEKSPEQKEPGAANAEAAQEASDEDVNIVWDEPDEEAPDEEEVELDADAEEAPDAPAADSAAMDALRKELMEAVEAREKEAEERQKYYEQLLRVTAEFDNFRKRTAREYSGLIENAERELIAELTEVLDNLDRALGTDHKGETVNDFAKGIELIRDQLVKALESRGLTRMETAGQPFNPDAHEALMRTPSDEHDEGTIVQEVSPGYRLKDTVIRHARVIVSQGKAEETESNESGDEQDL